MPFLQFEKRRIIGAGFVILLGLLLAPNTRSETQPEKEEAAARKPVVILTVDYGDGAQKRFPAIPWQEDMTVLSALEWAAGHPRGIKFSASGKGATTLVSKIDDLGNQGGRKKNWIFRVNDKLADRSCGVFSVNPSDRILWKFERYR